MEVSITREDLVEQIRSVEAQKADVERHLQRILGGLESLNFILNILNERQKNIDQVKAFKQIEQSMEEARQQNIKAAELVAPKLINGQAFVTGLSSDVLKDAVYDTKDVTVDWGGPVMKEGDKIIGADGSVSVVGEVNSSNGINWATIGPISQGVGAKRWEKNIDVDADGKVTVKTNSQASE